LFPVWCDAGLKPSFYKRPDLAGTNRPAGTREALPGTKIVVKTLKRLNVRTLKNLIRRMAASA